MRVLLSALVLTVFHTSFVQADESFCVQPMAADAVEGQYSLTVSDGLVMKDGKSAPLTTSSTSMVKLTVQDGDVYMEVNNQIVILSWTDTSRQSQAFGEFSLDLTIPVQTYRESLSCGTDQIFSMLAGGGLANTEEGYPLEFEYYLVPGVAGPNLFTGALYWRSEGTVGLRYVNLKPVE